MAPLTKFTAGRKEISFRRHLEVRFLKQRDDLAQTVFKSGANTIGYEEVFSLSCAVMAAMA